MLKMRERIITAQDLAEGTPQAIANARKEPLVVTENGRPAIYMLSPSVFSPNAPRTVTYCCIALVNASVAH